MKFLHTADVHLDSPMLGLARYGDTAPIKRIRGATRRAFERLVDLALAEDVSFVVIAGDLYDGERDDFQTAIFLQRQLRRLAEAGVPVVIAWGNHDAANQITKRLSLPPGVHLLPADEAGTVVIEEAGAACHGRSYWRRDVLDDLSATYPAPITGLLDVGVLHTALDGRPGHDCYAPTSIETLAHRGYGYWALGHVHAAEGHQLDGTHIVFPGNLCGRHIGEPGPKGACLVSYDGDTVTSVVHRDLAPLRWEQVEPDLARASSLDEVLAETTQALVRLQESTSGAELVCARVVLRLEAALAGSFLADGERCEAQLRADAEGDGDRLFLEHIRVRPLTRPDPEALDEAMSEVRAAFARLGSEDGAAELAEIAEKVLGPLQHRFGTDVLDQLSALGITTLDEDALANLLAEAEALLAAELPRGR